MVCLFILFSFLKSFGLQANNNKYTEGVNYVIIRHSKNKSVAVTYGAEENFRLCAEIIE